MKTTNISEFKNHFNRFISIVENGKEMEVLRKDIPIARIIPVTRKRKNNTILGCGKGSVKYNVDLTQPFIPLNDWNMLSSDGNKS
ncbi:type II toxin-antitoxin system Phd/YefM family antitoxin [candidate division KSB1 bacterium]|nr:type II toxin-antitoxin system Phd/YefM family antitoxin [candidate division KSB1 bacterium]